MPSRPAGFRVGFDSGNVYDVCVSEFPFLCAGGAEHLTVDGFTMRMDEQVLDVRL